MKKISILVLCLMAFGIFGFVSSALATEDVFADDEGKLTIGTTGGSGDLVIGLSPKVYGRYVNPGANAAAAQWFAIATAHPGGNTIYGTSQDVNNIYQKGFTTGTTLSTSNMTVPASSGSATAWTGTLGYVLN